MVNGNRKEIEKESVFILRENLKERNEGLWKEKGKEGLRRKSSRILSSNF